MSAATTNQAHVAFELIEHTSHQVVVIEFLSHNIASPAHARELGEQLHSLIRRQPPQFFIIDFSGVRSLGSTAFDEIGSFVQKVRPVWVCNLDQSLRLGAELVGLDDSAQFAANRRAAIAEIEKTARGVDQDADHNPA